MASVGGSCWWRPSLCIRVLFWRNTDRRWDPDAAMMGSQKDADLITTHALNKSIAFRWDESPEAAHCHHAKYFVVDAETAEEHGASSSKLCAFVGGMTLNDIVYDEKRHDTVLEVCGPSAVDVAANFKMRWNEHNVLSECEADKLTRAATTQIGDFGDFEFAEKGESACAQVCCSLCPRIYSGYEEGESSVHAMYYRAFAEAERSIYIESQHPGETRLLEILRWKLRNVEGFRAVLIVPIRMMRAICDAKRSSLQFTAECAKAAATGSAAPREPRYHRMFATLSSLKQCANFQLCGMYKWHRKGYDAMYVHSKLCIVDGKWLSIGSANFVDISFVHDHSELNVCVFDAVQSMRLLRALADKHCEKKDDTFAEMNDVQIVEYMMRTARENVQRKAAHKVLDGRLHALDPALYASE